MRPISPRAAATGQDANQNHHRDKIFGCLDLFQNMSLFSPLAANNDLACLGIQIDVAIRLI
jgi:hypothetical protein